MDLIIGLSYCIMSFVLMHKGLPRVFYKGKRQSLKLWLFACGIGVLGIAKIFGPEAGIYATNDILYLAGHLCLLSYTSVKTYEIFQKNPKCYWF